MEHFCFIIIPPAFLSASLFLSTFTETLNDGCVIDEDDDGDDSEALWAVTSPSFSVSQLSSHPPPTFSLASYLPTSWIPAVRPYNRERTGGEMMMKSYGGDARQWVWRSINSLWKQNGTKLALHTYTSNMGKGWRRKERVRGGNEESDKRSNW